MNTIQISLTDEIQKWIEREVQIGGFATLGDYVQELVREAKERQEVEDQLLNGLQSGELQNATPQWWRELRTEIESDGKLKGE